MRYRINFFFFSQFLILFAHISIASPVDEPIFESARTTARGRTFVAAPDSDEATKFNPATLAEAEKLHFQIRYFQLEGFIGENTITTISDVMKLTADSSGLGFLKTFQDKFGKTQYMRLQLMPLAIRILSFEMSPFIVNYGRIAMRNKTTPELSWLTDTYAGSNFSLGLNFGKQFAVGITIRPMMRFYLGGTMSFADILDFASPNSAQNLESYGKLKQGSGIGSDLGFIWKPSPTLRLGLTFQNIGDTGFGKGTETPPLLKQVISTGMHWRKPIGGKSWSWDIYSEIQDLLNNNDVSLIRLLHLGTELGTSYFSRDLDMGIAAGLNEGWPTLGCYADIFIARLDISNYAIEQGEYPGQKVDRRWGMSLRSSTTF